VAVVEDHHHDPRLLDHGVISAGDAGVKKVESR